MKHRFLICAAMLAGWSAVVLAAPLRRQVPVFARSTWNAQDAVDETPGYSRGMHTVSQSVFIPTEWQDQSVTFVALGANQEVWLRVNGQNVGHHIGGYTAFSFDLSPYLRYGEDNIISADITNEHNVNCPPLSADFTFFGGFYRDAYLLVTNRTHVSTTFFATNGVTIQTPQVSAEQATVRVTTRITNPALDNLTVEQVVNDRVMAVQKNCRQAVLTQQWTIDQPRLWSPTTPYLYTLTTRVKDKRGHVIDEVKQQFGLRYFSFDDKGRFLLNGQVLRLIGTNRHQCYVNHGWAVPDSIHYRDILNLKRMGGNYLRISHYPQDPMIMHLCDSLGILCSVEIPLVNAITESDAFTQNCLMMEEEMVWQNRNHPSVIMWGYANELLLRPPFRWQKGREQRHQDYLKNVNALCAKLNNRLHELDSERYTFAALHDYFPDYQEAGLDTVADVIGHNVYSGWYHGRITDIDAKMARIRQAVGSQPMLMSEYGADCDPRIRTDYPTTFDYSVDYALLFHRHYLSFLLSTDLLAGGNVWNLNDFHAEPRGNAIPHLNCKGLLTINRRAKDTYRYYQTQLAQQPMTIIGLSDSPYLTIQADSLGICHRRVPIFSNVPVSVTLNGKPLAVDSLFEGQIWVDVPFVSGENILTAGDATCRFYVEAIPYQLDKSFSHLYVSLGTRTYFTDGVCYLPEQAYRTGSWGYVGGDPYIKQTDNGPQPAADIDIRGTQMDPLYQTARMGLNAFRADVPDGNYIVTIRLAEFETPGEQEMSPYAQGNRAHDSGFKGRVMSLDLNGQTVADSLVLKTYQATDFIVPVSVTAGQGINLTLTAQEGYTILNAIEIVKQ